MRTMCCRNAMRRGSAFYDELARPDDTPAGHSYNCAMDVMRYLGRSAFLGVVLAYALAFSGLASARLAGEHAAYGHALAALEVICAEHGLIPPTEEDHERPHQHRDCPGCLASKCKSVGVLAQVSFIPTSIPRTESTVKYSGGALDLAEPHAPPGVSARGPPNLI